MRLFSVLLLGLLAISPAAGQSSTNAPPRALPVTGGGGDVAPRALPVNPAELTNAAPAAPKFPVAAPQPLAVPGGVNIHWYGHGFVYLTSSVGVRAAIDPFGPETVHYKFPVHLAADFVLISHESEDHGGAELLFGNPLIFRSVAAVGLNRANGILFQGTSLQRDPSGQGAANTAFTLKFDGITFCYLGQISAPLLEQEKQQLGHADVVFLPVGLGALSVSDMNQVAADLGAKVIIPINYKTDYSGDLPLRTLDDYLSDTKFPVQKFPSEEIVLTLSTLPQAPTVYALKLPSQAGGPPAQTP